MIINNYIKKYINNNYLEKLDHLKKTYISNQPFPHIVLDNFINEEILRKSIKSLSNLSELVERDFQNNIKKKIAFEKIEEFPVELRDLFYFLNSGSFLNWLNSITNIKEKLVPDPEFFAGGIHKCFKDGYLKVHTDYHKHPKTNLDRRLNLLIYLNDDWKNKYGGHLELFSNDNLSQSKKKILPIFNRLVIFSTTDKSYHGHPDPLNCPDDRQRYSIATWYYTNGRNDVSKSFLLRKNTTFWVNRDERDNVKSMPYSIKDYLKKFYVFRKLNQIINKK